MGKIYSDLKVFHFHSKLRDLEERRISAPLHIRLKPTNRCNHRCIYCCFRNDKLYLSELLKEEDQIPAGKMKEIIADLKDMKVKAVTFSGGGEPLAYPYIYQTVEELLRAGIKVAMLTNGGLLQGKIARLLAERASWVRISMDAADAETYRRIRNVDLEEFDRVCENISDFARMKRDDCQLGVNFVVGEENYNAVFEFLRLMKKLGVNHVKVHERVVSVRMDENNIYHTPLFKVVKDQLAQAFSDLADENFMIIDNYSDLWEDEHGKDYTYCPFIQCLTVIAADLNVYTCQDKL